MYLIEVLYFTGRRIFIIGFNSTVRYGSSTSVLRIAEYIIISSSLAVLELYGIVICIRSAASAGRDSVSDCRADAGATLARWESSMLADYYAGYNLLRTAGQYMYGTSKVYM